MKPLVAEMSEAKQGLEMAASHREKLYPLCDRMRQLALQIIDQSELTVTRRGFSEPKLLALSLLCRSLANLKGVVVLTQQSLAVEARVLARCCYENMFMVGGLYSEGEAFADRMIEDNDAGRKGRIGFAFETENIFQSLSVEMQEAVKETNTKFRAAPRSDFLKFKEASRSSPFKDTYLVYSQFSGDAAHPTIMALSRHWCKQTDKIGYFDVQPDPKESELDETLHLACISVIGMMVVVNEMNGFTEAGKQLPVLNAELVALQNDKWGPSSLNEGMEIMTEKVAS